MEELIIQIIVDIVTQYADIVREWKEEFSDIRYYNLRKLQICDVVEDSNFYDYTQAFRTFVDEKYQKITFMHNNGLLTSARVTNRVKSIRSMDDKIRRYNSGNLHGKMKVNKCLNDIVGFRIILGDNLNRIQIANLLSDKYSSTREQSFRITEASKNGYYATHVYFKVDNSCFPCEIQLWNMEDAKQNIKMHFSYKEDYTIDIKKGSE